MSYKDIGVQEGGRPNKIVETSTLKKSYCEKEDGSCQDRFECWVIIVGRQIDSAKDKQDEY